MVDGRKVRLGLSVCKAIQANTGKSRLAQCGIRSAECGMGWGEPPSNQATNVLAHGHIGGLAAKGHKGRIREHAVYKAIQVNTGKSRLGGGVSSFQFQVFSWDFARPFRWLNLRR
jgi:hypothetical protein